VRLDELGRFNVLIGRNNAGKSSVFRALALLSAVVSQGGSIEWDRVLTNFEATRALEIRLMFELRAWEREEFMNIIRTEGQGRERVDQLLRSPLLSRVEFFFKAHAGRPELLHLREIKILAEDGQWAVVERMTGSELVANPSSRITRLVNVAQRLPLGVLNSTSLDVESAAAFGGSSLADDFDMQLGAFESAFTQDSAIMWLRARLAEFIKIFYFFVLFIHSAERLLV